MELKPEKQISIRAKKNQLTGYHRWYWPGYGNVYGGTLMMDTLYNQFTIYRSNPFAHVGKA